MSDELKPAVLILGAPGSGKGTQGAVLGKIPRFYHYASGDVFRRLDTRTELGRQFVEFSRKGELVPDIFTVKLWASHMDDIISSREYKPDIDILVLDGIPRNLEQTKMLEEHVKIIQVFHLSCPDRARLDYVIAIIGELSTGFDIRSLPYHSLTFHHDNLAAVLLKNPLPPTDRDRLRGIIDD
ncbi:nucleoside monophosphate kinase [Akkermansiaceae bacterium]|nr:nucleoside monophosphate kinase [Akkermansiaceae bacterium]